MSTLLPQRGHQAARVILPLRLRGSRGRVRLPPRRGCGSARIMLEPFDGSSESGDLVREYLPARLEGHELRLDGKPLEACVHGSGLPILCVILRAVGCHEDVPGHLA